MANQFIYKKAPFFNFFIIVATRIHLALFFSTCKSWDFQRKYWSDQLIWLMLQRKKTSFENRIATIFTVGPAAYHFCQQRRNFFSTACGGIVSRATTTWQFGAAARRLPSFWCCRSFSTPKVRATAHDRHLFSSTDLFVTTGRGTSARLTTSSFLLLFGTPFSHSARVIRLHFISSTSDATCAVS